MQVILLAHLVPLIIRLQVVQIEVASYPTRYQVHEEEKPRNSMKKRTLGAICLGPMDNAQGGYRFMSLRTGKKIKRYSWTPIPMTQEVIDKVLYFGEQEKGPTGIEIRNMHGDLEHEDVDTADIKGVYDYDIQKNLYPSQIQRDDNNDDNNNNKEP